jgi:hypothetical protein
VQLKFGSLNFIPVELPDNSIEKPRLQAKNLAIYKEIVRKPMQKLKQNPTYGTYNWRVEFLKCVEIGCSHEAERWSIPRKTF